MRLIERIGCFLKMHPSYARSPLGGFRCIRCGDAEEEHPDLKHMSPDWVLREGKRGMR